jgi:hypothetical protein
MTRAEKSSLPELWVLPRSCSKKTPGRAVKLRHDHPLGAVDDEGTGRRHQRDLAHIDFLLLDFLDGIRCFAVEDDQANLRPQGRGKGQSPLLALGDVESRFGEREAHKLQARIATVADDRENGGKCSLQSLILALRHWHGGLQESREGLELSRQQVGNIKHADALGETLADTLFLGV